jgi:capsular exopolysaccharide synthesis family protein
MDTNYSPVSQTDDDNIDIKRYLSLFISNWYWFAIALFLSITMAYTINRYSQRVFSVSSTLLIKDDQIGKMNSTTSSVIPGGDIFRSQQNLKNEVGILKSFSLNNWVVKELKEFHVVYKSVGRRGIVESLMYTNCPFKVVYDSIDPLLAERKVNITILNEQKYKLQINGGLKIDTIIKFGERFFKSGFDFTIERRNSEIPLYIQGKSNRYYFYFEDLGILASQYRSMLSVIPIEKDASLVTLTISGPVPDQEIDYLNKLMDVYIRYGLDNKNQTADSTIKFINKQLEVTLDSLKNAEKQLEEFRSQNNFIDLSSESTIIQGRLERFENEKMAFELQLQYYNYLSEYLDLKNAGSTIISPTVMGINDQVLIKLVNELSAIEKEIEKIGFNIGVDQPAFTFIKKQAEETRDALKENVKNGIASLKLSISESQRKISDVELDINKLPTTERGFISIKRRFDLNNTVYTYLLEKRSESGIAKASNVSDNRIIDKASQFSLVLISPKTKKNLIFALIMGFILPMTLIALIDFFNDRVIDKRDIERKTKVPVIGFISHSESKNEIAVVEKPGSSLAESFRSVRTAIKYYIKENEVGVIAVSSTVSSEGKTFISINLAAIIAMLGKKVLLIGLDLRKPRINKVFDYNDSPGMSTYLSGNCDYKEIIKETQIKNLFYAPSGAIPPNPAELIETELMKKFMARAKKEFDIIIIDTPPVAIVTDTLLLAPYVDINLFIVRQRYTSRNTLEMIDQLNNHGELKNMAIIINDISLSGYYGYGMRYGYTHGYGYSYGYNYYGSNYYGKYGYSDKSKGYYIED